MNAEPPKHRGRLFVIAAASGTGKTSLVRALMAARPQLAFSVSFTTRAPRASEVNGRDYHFVDRPVFERMVTDGEFLEHAEVFGNAYGTARNQVTEALAEGRDLVLEIDWQGAKQIRSKLSESVQIFVLPPSRAALEQRLKERRTDAPEVIARRLAESVRELSHWREFEYVIVNDRFDAALKDLARVVDGAAEDLRRDRPELVPLIAALLAG